MASRQLRKLRKQQELLNLQNGAAERSDESDVEPVVAKPRGNMFSGFAALGDEGDGADEDDEGQNSEDEAPSQQPQQPQQEPQGELVKRSKKSKKKRKAKKTESPAPVQDKDESVDEIDRVLEELKLEAEKARPATTQPAAGKSANELNGLLRINFQHLKAMNEMRRLFGKAMDVAEVEERAENSRQRTLPQNMDLETFLSARAAHPGQGPKGNKNMFDTILRTNPWIDGKKTWPRGTAQGLKMIRVTEGSQEEVEFAFAHDKAYDSLEASFFGLVQMYDPMQIVYFLHRYPYHISSLIQVSKVARQDQNSALAADLIERAIFTFGRVSLSEFRKKLEKGQARLSFARPENRQFYLAGWNLIQKLVLKGTYRTALEWAKLFLSINHSDPYAMLNWIHVLAIRAREAQWFIDFCSSPLFTTPDLPTAIYAAQTLPLAHFQLKDTAAAKSTLIKGMETLPWLYCALFSALNLDTPPSIWGVQPRSDDEALHTQLYIHTAKDLWNTPQHIALLKEAAAAVTRVPHSTLPAPRPVSLSTARFIYLDNTPALMGLVPRQMLHPPAPQPNFDLDPLPPAREDNVFGSVTQQLPWMAAEQEQAARGSGEEQRVRRVRGELERLRERVEREVAEGIGRERMDDDDDEGVEEGRRQRGEGEGARRQPPTGLLDYLRQLLGNQRETVDNLEEWTAPTGMPGGWEDEVELEDDWGLDEFEGGDDFEGGGTDGEEERR
ncbi:hypothetical protein VTI74DRAFT_6284 [Chaetomium olivicolor]